MLILDGRRQSKGFLDGDVAGSGNRRSDLDGRKWDGGDWERIGRGFALISHLCGPVRNQFVMSKSFDIVLHLALPFSIPKAVLLHVLLI